MRKHRAAKGSRARATSYPETVEQGRPQERLQVEECILRLRELTLSIKEMLHL